nr:DUF2490 domain-containing protein [Allomuricauda sp.]
MGQLRFPALFLLLIFNTPLYSQLNEESVSGSWLEFSGTGKIHQDWSIPIAGIMRHHDLFETYDFSFVRTGISYHFNTSSILTGGIAYVNSKSYTADEHTALTTQFWLYSEYCLNTNFGKNKVSHRGRLENRWITNNDGTRFNNRLRYRLQFTRSLHGKTFVKSFNELFVSLDGHWFNQNRFYLGIGRELSPNLKIDIGYLKNHFRDSHLDAIRMGLNFSLDLTKSEIAYFED